MDRYNSLYQCDLYPNSYKNKNGLKTKNNKFDGIAHICVKWQILIKKNFVILIGKLRYIVYKCNMYKIIFNIYFNGSRVC